MNINLSWSQCHFTLYTELTLVEISQPSSYTNACTQACRQTQIHKDTQRCVHACTQTHRYSDISLLRYVVKSNFKTMNESTLSPLTSDMYTAVMFLKLMAGIYRACGLCGMRCLWHSCQWGEFVTSNIIRTWHCEPVQKFLSHITWICKLSKIGSSLSKGKLWWKLNIMYFALEILSIYHNWHKINFFIINTRVLCLLLISKSPSSLQGARIKWFLWHVQVTW